MKTVFRTLVFAALLLQSMNLFAQSPIRLYPGKAPGSETWTHKEVMLDYMSPIWHEMNQVVLNVVDPEIIPYLPTPGTETGAAVLVCPGGGFYALSWNNEGTQVAQWLADHGITAFILKYRVSYSGDTMEDIQSVADHNYGGVPRDDAYQALAARNREKSAEMGDFRKFAHDDACTAIRYIRSHAKEYGINPDRIGMVGFSAGGILSLDVLDDHDAASKPNLVGCIYGSFFAKDELPADPCPLFIAADQPEIPGKASDLFALWTKNNLPCEIHAFTDSSHGFGYRPNGRSENMWITLFVNFMKKVHFID